MMARRQRQVTFAIGFVTEEYEGLFVITEVSPDFYRAKFYKDEELDGTHQLLFMYNDRVERADVIRRLFRDHRIDTGTPYEYVGVPEN